MRDAARGDPLAEFRLVNEFGSNFSLAVLEPSRECIAKCTWCYLRINRRQNGPAESPDPGTFERAVERALGPAYDPSDLLQWSLRERVPFVWASGVEPWQDVDQSRAILSVIRRAGMNVLFQTRGTNWREVWPDVLPLAGHAGFYVSIPSLDPRYVKRFEPKTPPIEERVALVRAASEAGFRVMVAVAPYHPEWCPDLPELVRQAHGWGARDLFIDTLHLNRTQRLTIKGLDRKGKPAPGLGGDAALIPLADSAWSDFASDQWGEAADLCLELGMGFETTNPLAIVDGIRSTSPDPADYFPHARPWPYLASAYLDPVADAWEEDPSGPILVEWPAALAAMERSGRVDQPFSMTSVGVLTAIKGLPEAWRKSLGRSAPAREYFRALWDNPGQNQAPWSHPFVRYAVTPEGAPWRGDGGDLVLAYDPGWPGRALARTFEPAAFEDARRLTIED